MVRIVRNEDGSHDIWQDGARVFFHFRKARKLPWVVEVREMTEPFSVETLEGTMEGKAGDILICGIKGEMYPCDRDVFFSSYEFVRAGEE